MCICPFIGSCFSEAAILAIRLQRREVHKWSHIQPNRKAIGNAIMIVHAKTAAKVTSGIPIKTMKNPKNR